MPAGVGNFKYLCDNPLPEESEESYLPTLCYAVRSHVALKNYTAALALLPTANTTQSVKALRALIKYFTSTPEETESPLEELRDLCLEVEDEDGEGEEGAGPGLVKVAAATAFIHENELEEALTTLGAGCKSKNIEWYVLIDLATGF